ncbi:unnamed protein product [Polarella glacialis]|uniref:JmjC domain-containing protein n=1 Tax=Polarella glacialis TaxID=89957 RepID=A0A813HV25_POLGL|nr:unnamed protein product [Polarella glacialis]
MLRSPVLADGSWPPPTGEELAALAAHLAGQQSPLPPVDGKTLKTLDRSKPLRLRGLIDAWPARSWDREQFLDRLGSLPLRIRPSASLHEYGFPGPAELRAPLRSYFENASKQATGVVFENDFHAVHTALQDAYWVPKLLAGVHGAPIFSAARQHTGVGFHHHHESWLAQLKGRKVWLLVPPGAPRPAAVPPWWNLLQPPEGLLVCVLEPGEVMFLPEKWWHATWNLDECTLALGWEGSHCSSRWCEAMHAIADGDMQRLVGWGLRSTKPVTPQMTELAARAGHTDMLRWLLRDDADAALRAHPGPVVLAAARGGHVSVLQLLLSHGLESSVFGLVTGKKASSALHEAARYGHPAAVEWLIQHRADVSLRDLSTGSAPIHLAAFHGHGDITQALLDAASSAEAQDAQGSVPLLQAAFSGHLSVVQVLLRAGALPAVKDILGMTPLHHAALRGHAELATVLVAARCSVQACDNQGRTPLHLAAHGYEDTDDPIGGIRSASDANLQVTLALLNAGAHTGMVDRCGACPADYAKLKGHPSVESLLRGGHSLQSAELAVAHTCSNMPSTQDLQQQESAGTFSKHQNAAVVPGNRTLLRPKIFEVVD